MIVLKTGGTGRKGCGVGRKGKMEDKRKSSIKRRLLVMLVTHGQDPDSNSWQ